MLNKSVYANASVVVAAGVCLVMAADYIIGLVSGAGNPSIFPGFSVMAGLCCPILCFWIGLLVRRWLRNPKWWVQLIVLGVAVMSLYYYRHFAENTRYLPALYLALVCLGYLIPPKALLSSTRNKGWISLAMVAVSAFCYTAMTTVRNRLLLGPMIPSHPDMEGMMETVLVNAEPLMVIVVIYFVTQFAFSSIAQDLGRKKWFIWASVVPCAYSFLIALVHLFTMHHYFIVNFTYYNPLIDFIIQPVTVYIVIFLAHLIKRHLKVANPEFCRK